MSALNVRIVRRRMSGVEVAANWIVQTVAILVAAWFLMLLAPLTALNLNLSYGAALASIAAVRCFWIGLPGYTFWTQQEAKR